MLAQKIPTIHKRVNRLSRYRRAAQRLKELGFSRVVSNTLGEEVGVTASQVRKDFSHFGISGNKKGGYQIDPLLKKFNHILGKDKTYRVILVGAGRIGTSLIEYRNFEKEGLEIVAAFDIDPAKVTKRQRIPVQPMEKLYDYVKWNDIKIGIIAVPAVAAQTVCDQMLAAGIKGILNFAPRRLRVDSRTHISNVNILAKLENLVYFVKEQENV
jgi:redox-sensing transcriptional repressor